MDFHNAYYVCTPCVLSVHNFGDTYCFCADKLDARVIVKARRTASSRIEKLIKEMDKENDLTLKREASSIAKRIENSVEQALRKGG